MKGAKTLHHALEQGADRAHVPGNGRRAPLAGLAALFARPRTIAVQVGVVRRRRRTRRARRVPGTAGLPENVALVIDAATAALAAVITLVEQHSGFACGDANCGAEVGAGWQRRIGRAAVVGAMAWAGFFFNRRSSASLASAVMMWAHEVHRGPERSEASSRRAIPRLTSGQIGSWHVPASMDGQATRARRDCVEELERLGRRHCLIRESFQRIVNRFDSTTAAGLRISRSPCLRLDEHDFPEPVDDVRGARACHAPAAADGVATRSAGPGPGNCDKDILGCSHGRRPTRPPQVQSTSGSAQRGKAAPPIRASGNGDASGNRHK